MPELQDLAATPGVFWQRADMCMYGLTTPDLVGAEMPAMKPTGFLSTAWCVLEELSLVCDGSHAHQGLVGGRAAAAAEYTPQLCRAICRGYARQRRYDSSGMVGGQGFGRGELKSLVRKLLKITGTVEKVEGKHDNDRYDNNNNNNNNVDSSEHVYSHPDQKDGVAGSERHWTDCKHEPDGTDPTHIVLAEQTSLDDDCSDDDNASTEVLPGPDETGGCRNADESRWFRATPTDAMAETRASVPKDRQCRRARWP